MEPGGSEASWGGGRRGGFGTGFFVVWWCSFFKAP